MFDQPLASPLVPTPSASGPTVRVEYVGFQQAAEHREFRFRICGDGNWSVVPVRIAMTAFAAGRIRLQDGPDACYQKLLRVLGEAEATRPEVITLDDAELASHRVARTPVVKRRARPAWAPLPEPRREPQPLPRPRARPAPAPLPVAVDTEPVLEEGQRVSHAIFGVGVTALSGGGHTVIRFDIDGPKTFVTSMLKLDVLSAPHTWEISPRGINRPCGTPAPAA